MRKFFPYILILVILAGILSPLVGVHASTTNPNEACNNTGSSPPTNKPCKGSSSAEGTCDVTIQAGYAINVANCANAAGQTGHWTPVNGGPVTGGANATTGNALKDNIQDCSSFGGCIQFFFFHIFYGITSFFLIQSANFFNALVALGLSSSLYNSPFVGTAWAIVRDLSNIFFILVLLYVAIQMILDIGGHDAKKMIAKVIIMALLINFSMFFSGVIIDASNILALIFYNKLDVSTTISGQDATYVPITNTPGEKDISGGMVNAFDPSHFLTQDFFDELRDRSQVVPTSWGTAAIKAGLTIGIGALNPVAGIALGTYQLYGYFFPTKEIPLPTILAVITLSALIMGFAAYAFFIAGIAFLSRLIELWVLIIFSPFAFMSSTIPLLEKVPDIGWDDWLKRIFKASFMAPIFLFFMYFIFLLVKAKPFASFSSISDPAKQTPIQTILYIVLPAILILTLLLKAAKFSKKYSGTIGEMTFAGAKMVGGLALGAATGGAAMLARGTIGRAGAAVASSAWAKRLETQGVNVAGFKGISKFAGARIRDVGKAAGTSSLDIRGVKIAGQSLAGVTGMKLGEAQKGGFEQMRKDQVKKRMDRAKELEVGEDEASKQTVRARQADLHHIKTGTIRNAAGVEVRRQDEIVRLNNGANEADSAAAAATLEAADRELAANPTDPALIAAQQAAEAAELATRGLGKLERNVATADRAVVAAERAVKDAVDKLANANADLARDPSDPALIAAQARAEYAVQEAREDRDKRIRGGGTLSDGTVVLARDTQEATREKLETRQGTLRATEGPIKDAENALKMAENAVIAINAERREDYAANIESALGQTMSAAFGGVSHSFAGNREAANKIRAEIQEEKTISHH